MWNSTENVVENYLANESTIRSKSLVVAEWNLNIVDNINEIGNYRYRPSDTQILELDDDNVVTSVIYDGSPYNFPKFKVGDTVPETFNIYPNPNFAEETALTATQYYYNATDSDVVVDGGFDSNGDPLIFTSKQKKMKSLFSLEDCLGRFRPRSGINKVIYFDGKYLNRVHPDMAQQPRFYFPTPSDRFKYWTSYRTEGMGIDLEASVTKVYATETVNGQKITKVRAIANDFQTGDSVTFTGTGLSNLDNKTFIVHSSSSNYIKILGDITSTTTSAINGLVTGKSAKNLVRGIAYSNGSNNSIDDAVPFVVYKNLVPSNRIVVKMQTKVGSINLGPYSDADGKQFDDPFYDTVNNKAVPKNWKIQVLNQSNQWTTAYDFSTNSTYSVPAHGQAELAYGLIVPSNTDNNNLPNLRDIFLIAGEIASTSALPAAAPEGYAYLVTSPTGPGTFYVAYNSNGDFAGYDTFPANYGWYLNESEIPLNTTSFVSDFTNPAKYIQNSVTKYRDFEYIKGMRIVIDSMTIEDATFDLIEMSPRLAGDLTGMTKSISVTKHASDLGSSGMPVGQLLASTGSMEIFDYDQSFNGNNSSSIIKDLSTKNLQIKFYESIDPGNGTIYTIPIKTLYADGFPQTSHENRNVSIKLRDLFFYFESMKAPELLIPNCSLSMAVSCLMDSIGFSNYTFKRPDGEKNEAVIPYFFVGPDTTIAQALEDLAVSTQTAMFLDEYNNLVLMSKEYMMPKDESTRPTDFTFIGDNTGLANIMQLQSVNDDVYNDGKISYESKYIQRSYASLSQANYLDSDKTWVYKPVLLWEVSPEENTKAWNDENGKQSAYTLAAIPLASDLSANLPTVVNGKITNNVMNLGEAVYWISRYNGYFYANGEIIKFDAVEYDVSGVGTVWISGVEEYQKYFANLPFAGKIYPTGLVRIYAEPYYDEVNDTLKEGAVAKHGRMQFGTGAIASDGTRTPVYHKAGLDSYWEDPSNQRTIKMKYSYMFNGGTVPATYQNVSSGVLTSATRSTIKKATVNGVIRNYLSTLNIKESSANLEKTAVPGTVQSSALVMDGPTYPSGYNPLEFLQYTYKSMDSQFSHFETRMRIIGAMEDERSQTQTPSGSNPYYTINGENIGGSSGGLAVWVDPTTNCGYYFEIVALTDTTAVAYDANAQAINTMFFYKIQADANGNAIPIVLWSGLAPIVCDDGRFTGQERQVTEKNTTVYDLGVEFAKDKKTKLYTFNLYLNDKLVGRATDKDPLKKTNNIALFVRGSARVMFENLLGLSVNFAEDRNVNLNTPVDSVFGFENNNASLAARKYSLSGAIRNTFLSGVSGSNEPKYNIYFEEFGTIMREAAYFNVKYDKAYPALHAKMSPTFNNNQGYAVSGFTANAFGAEFLIFNTTDTVLKLDSGSGNYLRIQGVAFTQNSRHDLTVDEFFADKGELSDPDYRNGKVYNEKYNDSYLDIKKNRLTYGTKAFTINAPYIQSQDAANDLMSWLSGKIMKSRKAVGMEILSMPHLQLGDIVKIQYEKDGVNQVSEKSSGRYVVYSIEYQRSTEGPSMTMYLSEVK